MRGIFVILGRGCLQPVEQLAALRAIPGLTVIRPCDANEVVEAWRVVIELRHEPAALVLTRQDVPVLDRSRYASAEGLRRGGYVLAEPPEGEPELILIATGSEVQLAVAAYEELTADGMRARVVSMPSWELFDRQPREYRDDVLPPGVTARVAVEQASTLGWERYVGHRGAVIGMHTFGASAPLRDVQRKFGFTPERVVEVAREVLPAAHPRPTPPPAPSARVCRAEAELVVRPAVRAYSLSLLALKRVRFGHLLGHGKADGAHECLCTPSGDRADLRGAGSREALSGVSARSPTTRKTTFVRHARRRTGAAEPLSGPRPCRRGQALRGEA